MMTKFYCNISRNHTAYLHVGGVARKIIFDNSAGNAAGFGELVTNDTALIAALTADPRNGKEWFAATPLSPKPEAVIPPIILREKTCRTLNEASEWLVALGCTKNKINTTDKAVAAAKSLGYALRFEKGE